MLRVPHHTPSRYQVWALQVSLQLVVSPKGIQSLWGRGALPPAQGRSALCHLRRCLTPRLSMFRAAACVDAGGESNSFVDGTRRDAWSGSPNPSTGNVRKKGDSPKENVDFLWGSPSLWGSPTRQGPSKRYEVFRVGWLRLDV